MYRDEAPLFISGELDEPSKQARGGQYEVEVCCTEVYHDGSG